MSVPLSAASVPTVAQLADTVEARYYNDPIFHARVKMAVAVLMEDVQAKDGHSFNEGERRLALRAAAFGTYFAEVQPQT